MCDRINNIQSMTGVFSNEKQRKYIDEVNTHFIPMIKKSQNTFPEQTGAYFNGLYFLRSQIELIEATLEVSKKVE